jgi:hypothetical protein
MVRGSVLLRQGEQTGPDKRRMRNVVPTTPKRLPSQPFQARYPTTIAFRMRSGAPTPIRGSKPEPVPRISRVP